MKKVWTFEEQIEYNIPVTPTETILVWNCNAQKLYPSKKSATKALILWAGTDIDVGEQYRVIPVYVIDTSVVEKE